MGKQERLQGDMVFYLGIASSLHSFLLQALPNYQNQKTWDDYKLHELNDCKE